MMEGLWTAEFGTSTGMFGGGIAVFREGKVLGGDGTYFYIGEYKERGDTFVITLKISPFIEGAPSVFGTVGQELTLELSGISTADGKATAQGHLKGMPYPKFGVK